MEGVDGFSKGISMKMKHEEPCPSIELMSLCSFPTMITVNLSNYLPLAGRTREGFIPISWGLAQIEMQSILSRI